MYSIASKEFCSAGDFYTQEGKTLMRFSGATILGAAIAAMIMLSGCATVGEQSDEDQIIGVFQNIRESLAASDLEMFMAAYSEDYEGEGGEGVEVVQRYVSILMEQGAFEEFVIMLDDMEIEVDGNKAKAGPVTHRTIMEDFSIDYIMAKEQDGIWRIVGSIE
jgi:hypothetical protein